MTSTTTWQRFATTREGCRPFFTASTGSASEGKISYALSDHPSPPPSDPPPPWRTFLSEMAFRNQGAAAAWERWLRLRCLADTSERHRRARTRAASFVLPDSAASRNLVLAVNAALSLRRPLLLTGLPGSGKTTLAYAVAEWLGLGPVLEWSVTPGASLAEALASYDPLARLQDLEIARKTAEPQANQSSQASQPPQANAAAEPMVRPVEHYMRLGPVGTAFLPMPLPRVLLIDEIDKGDLNLAHELLHLFEEGKFTLSQLQRDANFATAGSVNAVSATAGSGSADPASSNPSSAGSAPGAATGTAQPRTIDSADEEDNGQAIPVTIYGAVVQCHAFPLVVMTSNGEREFPPAFNRRCLRVPMPDFSRDPASLEAIVRSHWASAPQPTGSQYAGQPTGQPASSQPDGQDAASLPLAQLDVALRDFQAASQAAQGVGDSLALDQLLNLAFLLEQESPPVSEATRQDLRQVLLQALNAEPEQPPDPGAGRL
ncbi:MAG: AAA family ATPase [Synechococcaceae cyanobacterium]